MKSMEPWRTVSPTFPIALFLAGTAVGVLGVVGSAVWRRAEQTLGSLFWAGSGLAAHPERYVRADRVSVVRILNMTGVILWLIGVVMILMEAVARVF